MNKDCNQFKMIDFIDFIVIILTNYSKLSSFWLPNLRLLKNLIEFITIKPKIQEIER